ncbi:hypothetical protein [Sneathiella aquimaris]|uniref:hypothetical protein n=1 Tax=Sneathiella aquimaris TaxID=2599305 RepID=UPI00146C2872|nr:hypothetical protein [Sneathiella aquimaris]
MRQFFERLLVGRSGYNTISKHAVGFDRFVGLLTIFAAALLGFGVAAPLVTLNGYLGLDGQYSLVIAAMELVKTGHGAYSVGLLVLFVVIPVLSISTVFDLWYKHELHSDKLQKLIPRAKTCGRLWFFVMMAVIAGIYYSRTLLNDTVLHVAVYYLLISIILQKLTLARVTRLLASIKFVEEKD